MTKKTDKQKPWNAYRAEERQEYYYLIYEQMGTGRSLKRLWALVHGAGMNITLKTLGRYSSKYHWQSRILERAARHESADFQDIQDQVSQMEIEHSKTFQDIGALVTAGIAHWQIKMRENVEAGLAPMLEMDLKTIGQLAHTYQKG